MSLAWHVEALRRQKKLPSLRSLLSRSRTRGPQNVQQQRVALAILSEQYGIPMRPTTERRKRGGPQ